jgi:hypothetical protein
MGANTDIKKALLNITKRNDSIYTIVCTVDSVDIINKTCYCIPIDKSGDLQDVRLMASTSVGFWIVPTINSVVLVTMLNNTTGYVAQCSEFDFMYLNGDAYGGLVKVQELTDKLNDLENAFNQHILLYNAHTHAETSVNTLVPNALDTQVLIPTIKTELENLTVKHGDGT